MKRTPLNRDNLLSFKRRINHYMNERTKLDLNTVYNHLKEKYLVVLTNAYALENGSDFDEDYQLLYGESPAGKFLLYDDGLDIIFDADKADGTYTHWHPLDTEEAIKDVIQFMDGIPKY